MNKKFDDIVEYIEKNEINIFGVSIVENGEQSQKVLIDEDVNIFSIGKSITALCIYILNDQNKLELTDKIIKYFPEMKYSVGTEKITIQNLLDMRSTKDCSFIGTFPEDGEDYLERFFEYECTLEKNTFRYSNFCSYTLGRIITKITDKTTLEFANEMIFKPLGIKQPRWATDNRGYTVCANNLFLGVDSLSKIAELMRGYGTYKNKEIIKRIHFSQFSEEFSCPESELEYKNSFWNVDIADGYFMKGIFSNIAMVIPKLDISIAITASEKDNDKRDRLLSFIIETYTK